jgi:hypothetical protein
MYDKKLGRFQGIDKLADLFPSITPMIYSYNNPIKFRDPLGLAGKDSVTVLQEVEVTATRLPSYSELYASYLYSSSPVKRVLGREYKRKGMEGVQRLWYTNRTLHFGGMEKKSQFSKDFGRVWGTALNVGVTGTVLLASASPMLIELLVESAPASAGERGLSAGMEFVSQLASGTSFGNIDWFDVGASGALGFNTFGSVITSSNINLTFNDGLSSDFGTSTGAINMATGFVAAGINEKFIDKQVQSMTSKIVLKLGVDWVLKIEGQQIDKSIGQ